MKAWQITNYKGALKLVDQSIPYVRAPNDVLIKVKAASINPIDCEMKDGYGAKVVSILRNLCSFPMISRPTFPLILGRDFSGIVSDVGSNIKSYKPGDEVWGALGVQRQGSHAEYTIASGCSIAHKPKSLTHIDAASLPYVSMTVLSSLLCFSPNYMPNLNDKTILIRGGAGGIGTIAIQLMKSFGARTIITTCGPNSVEALRNLGADEALDYKAPDILHSLKQLGPYDLVYDPIGGTQMKEYLNLLRPWSGAKYVCIASPLLKNTDIYGVPLGFGASLLDMNMKSLQALSRGNLFAYGYFAPNRGALKIVGDLVEEGKIIPVIEKVVDFDKVPQAYDDVKKRHGRGKTVIQMPDDTVSAPSPSYPL